MKLLSMTATFGKLDRAELTLSPGLNVIAAPNEFGKSTWAAFLLAMLYGVDTAERASRTNLPVKTKYKPWSGQAMEGRLELEHQGRCITIERTSQGRGVLNSFRAFDTESGQPLDFLREDTCGQTLLGVPRSVFERSGFIRQQGLAVTGDAALEARLTALVTSGDETVSYRPTEKRLRDLKNRRRHNKTGLLPQAEQALGEVTEALEAMASLGRENMQLQARQDLLQDQEQTLRRQLAGLEAALLEKKRAQLTAAQTDWGKKAQCLEDKRQTVAGLPELDALQELVRQLDTLLEQEAVLENDRRLGVAMPQEPERPAVFAGLGPDELRQRAEDDCRALEQLPAPPRPGKALWVAACVLAVLGVALLLVLPPVGVGLLAAAVLAGAGAMVRRAKGQQEAAAIARRRASLLEPYGAADGDEIRRMAGDCREALLLYGQQLAAATAQQQALDRRLAEAAASHEALLGQVRQFAPEAQDVSPARAAAQQAVYRRQFFAAAAREEALSRAQYQAVREALGTLAPTEAAADLAVEALDKLDAGQLAAQLEQVCLELRQVRSRLDQQRGRMLALGDPAALAAQQEELAGRKTRLELELSALELALAALSKANDTLQTRFSPRLGALAADYMAKLTHGRYDRVLLTQDMEIHTRQAGDVVSRPLLAVSAGTADQLYLAVRLAISQLALGEDTPLVLDDALALFDDTRMAAAMALLEEQAQHRQILLFTCHHREQHWLEASHREAQKALERP